MFRPVQTVQAVQTVSTPSFILPRVAGEERGGGLNGAQRLNRAERLNGLKEEMIEVKSLVKIFADGNNAGVKAVNQVSFTVEEGRFYTLLGPSGCGKTTTLRCIAGLEKADEGEIIVAGAKVYSASEGTFAPAYRRPIGMVFQSYAIWPHLSVFENVAFPLRVGKQRFSSDDIRKKVSSASGTSRVGRL